MSINENQQINKSVNERLEVTELAHSFYQLMHEKDELIRNIIETSGIAMVTVDIKGIIRSFNPAAEKLFAYREYEVIGQSSKLIVPSSYEAVGRSKNGTKFAIDLSISPSTIAGERLFTWVIKDISNIQAMENKLNCTIEKLQKSNRELSQITFISTHDLQEPLRLVASYMQLLANRYQGKLDKDANEYIDFAIKGVKRMKALTHDLVTYAEVSQEDCNFIDLDLNKLVNEAVESLKPITEETNSVIIYNNLPRINGSAKQLKELFYNLINNAIQYRSQAAPEIHINSERQGNNFMFSVKDNGIGIAAEYSSKIFDIFQRLDKKDEDLKSTGIGLSICKKIVENHHGEIWLESELGKGTTFFFTIQGN